MLGPQPTLAPRQTLRQVSAAWGHGQACVGGPASWFGSFSARCRQPELIN